MRLILPLMLACLLALNSCSYAPVRHLASDAALIKVGESTRKDVLRYLGEPDSRRTVAPGVEEYMYSEEQKSQLARLPLAGRMMDAERREALIITLNGEQVTGCEFRLSKKGDGAWRDKAGLENLR